MILTINTGSSSTKLALFELGKDDSLKEVARKKYPKSDLHPEEQLDDFLASTVTEQIAPVVHRFVHGGPQFSSPQIVDDEVLDALQEVSKLAPLHNPSALQWLLCTRERLGTEVEQIAVFDTEYFSDLPAIASTYPLPGYLRNKYQLKRYGFHGLAHESLYRSWKDSTELSRDPERVISLQLGSGCSAAAICNGKSIDTSMGFSPLEGLVMATRPGDLDTGIIYYLLEQRGVDSHDLFDLLHHSSGLLGISGKTSEISRLLEDPSREAQLAVDIFCYRIRKYIGAYTVALGGLDALLFGGGIAEHLPELCARLVTGLECLGIEGGRDIPSTNVDKPTRLSLEGDRPEIWVIPVDEEALLAEKAISALRAQPKINNNREYTLGHST